MLPFRNVTLARWTRLVRIAAYGFLSVVLLLTLAHPAFAAAAGEVEKPNFFMQVLSNLFDSKELMKTLGQPEFALAAFLVLNVVVFTETGLLVGFFLPGDSLLVTAGLVAANPACNWSLPLLLGTLSLAAILGDTVGYMIGYQTGPKIFSRDKSLFFNKDHLLKAQSFYERRGSKTIVIARFIPILRTFAPVVAGVGKMNYRRFVIFNIFGGTGWVCSMVLCGFLLPQLLNPLLKPVFGDAFAIEEHVEKVVFVVVFLSIAPWILTLLKSKLAGSSTVGAPKAPEEATAKVAG